MIYALYAQAPSQLQYICNRKNIMHDHERTSRNAHGSHMFETMGPVFVFHVHAMVLCMCHPSHTSAKTTCNFPHPSQVCTAFLIHWATISLHIAVAIPCSEELCDHAQDRLLGVHAQLDIRRKLWINIKRLAPIFCDISTTKCLFLDEPTAPIM